MDIYQKIIVSSAPLDEIESFLESLAIRIEGKKYCFYESEVILVKTWGEKMGSLYFQRTEILFFGKIESVNDYVKAFRLKFLSAGG